MLGVFSTMFFSAAPAQAAAARGRHGGHGGHGYHGHTYHRGYHGWSHSRWSPRYGCNVYYSSETCCWYRFNPGCGCYVQVPAVGLFVR